MTPIAPLITSFLREHMPIEQGYSPHTCETYAATRNGRLRAVKAFIRYVEFRVPSALAQARQVHAIPGKRHDQALVGCF
jgi:integrase/recombinase XerD